MPLAREDVVAVLGPSGEDLVTEIVATGASRLELAEAWAWINADEALIREGRPPPTGVVAQLVELLMEGPEEEEP